MYSYSGQGGPADVVLSQSCKFQGTTAGSCVDVDVFNGGRETFTTSYTGTLTPFVTITQTASIPGQTQSSGTLARCNSDIWGINHLIGLAFGAIVLCIVV